VVVHHDGDITIKEKEFRRYEVLWEVLTRKRAIKKHVTSDDRRTYKKILQLMNAHLEGYHPGGVICVSQRETVRKIIAPLFARPKSRCVELGLRRAWKKY
jgi:hypothetical protein